MNKEELKTCINRFLSQLEDVYEMDKRNFDRLRDANVNLKLEVIDLKQQLNESKNLKTIEQ